MTGRVWVTAATITAAAVVAAGTVVTGGLVVLGSTMSGSDLVAGQGWGAGATGPAALQAAAQARAAMTPDDAAAVVLLARAARSAVSVAYAGSTVSVSGSVREVVGLANLPGIGTVVTTAGRSAVLAGEGDSASIADAARVLGLLADNYRVLRESARDRTIAGRPAEEVEAHRPDGTLAARFWLDRATGLLLRRDLVAPDGTVVASTTFTAIRLGRAAVGPLPPLASDPWSATLDDTELAARRAAGCTCALALPGGLTLLHARVSSDDDAGPPDVVHLLYSDGLSEVSVFDQVGRLDPDSDALSDQGFQSTTYAGVPVLERAVGAGGPDAVSEWVWQCGRSVVTMVGPAVPYGEAQQRAAAIIEALYVAPSADPGLTARIARGWDRAVDAVQRSWDRLTTSTASSHAGGMG